MQKDGRGAVIKDYSSEVVKEREIGWERSCAMAHDGFVP